MKQQKGITLIALVITIIVLLILAGVTIAMLGGNDSAPNKASEAKVQNDVGAAKDAVTIQATERLQDWYDNKFVKNQSGLVANAGLAVIDDEFTPSAGVTVTIDNTASGDVVGTVTIKSTEGRASDGKKYQVVGNVNKSGSIEWQATSDANWVN